MAESHSSDHTSSGFSLEPSLQTVPRVSSGPQTTVISVSAGPTNSCSNREISPQTVPNVLNGNRTEVSTDSHGPPSSGLSLNTSLPSGSLESKDNQIRVDVQLRGPLEFRPLRIPNEVSTLACPAGTVSDRTVPESLEPNTCATGTVSDRTSPESVEPNTREFDDAAHEDVFPVNEGGSYHEMQVVNPPHPVDRSLSLVHLDEPQTRGMAEQAIENQVPISVNRISNDGVPVTQVNWITAAQEGGHDNAPVPPTEQALAMAIPHEPRQANRLEFVQLGAIGAGIGHLVPLEELVPNAPGHIPVDRLPDILQQLANMYRGMPTISDLLRGTALRVAQEVPTELPGNDENMQLVPVGTPQSPLASGSEEI